MWKRVLSRGCPNRSRWSEVRNWSLITGGWTPNHYHTLPLIWGRYIWLMNAWYCSHHSTPVIMKCGWCCSGLKENWRRRTENEGSAHEDIDCWTDAGYRLPGYGPQDYLNKCLVTLVYMVLYRLQWLKYVLSFSSLKPLVLELSYTYSTYLFFILGSY